MILTPRWELDTLSKGSRKKILISCDYCKSSFSREYRRQIEVENNNKNLNKDFCSECIKIKNAEIFITTLNFHDIEEFVNNMVAKKSSIISGVYAIRNKNSNKSYIGSSKDIIYRWKTHFQLSEKENHYVEVFREIDIKDIEFIVLEYNVPYNELVNKEYYYIQLFNTGNRKYGYNTMARKKSRKKIDMKTMSTKLRLESSKLSITDIKDIKTRLYDNERITVLSEEYKINYNTVHDIKTCRTWENILPHLNKELKNIKYETDHIGSKNPDSKLTEEKVLQIKKLLSESERTMTSIAKEYGVSRTLISHIKYGRLWTHVHLKAQ